jgi:hypothetical protein
MDRHGLATAAHHRERMRGADPPPLALNGKIELLTTQFIGQHMAPDSLDDEIGLK